MAEKNKYLQEAACAAVLATHSAAGLAFASSSREAARLLQAAGALARSAIAIISASSTRTSSNSATSCSGANVARSGSPVCAGDGITGDFVFRGVPDAAVADQSRRRF